MDSLRSLRRALTLQELEDITNDPDFYNDEDNVMVNIAVIPPDTNYLTNEDVDDKDLSVVEIQDILGQFEVQ